MYRTSVLHVLYAQVPDEHIVIHQVLQMGGGGFEPPKRVAADLQSVPFGHSGIRPYLYIILYREKADDRTRTDNLLITNQLLCQLSHIGIMEPIGLEPMTLCL